MSGRDTVLRAVREVPLPPALPAGAAEPDLVGLFTDRAADYRATVA